MAQEIQYLIYIEQLRILEHPPLPSQSSSFFSISKRSPCPSSKDALHYPQLYLCLPTVSILQYIPYPLFFILLLGFSLWNSQFSNDFWGKKIEVKERIVQPSLLSGWRMRQSVDKSMKKRILHLVIPWPQLSNGFRRFLHKAARKPKRWILHPDYPSGPTLTWIDLHPSHRLLSSKFSVLNWISMTLRRWGRKNRRRIAPIFFSSN